MTPAPKRTVVPTAPSPIPPSVRSTVPSCRATPRPVLLRTALLAAVAALTACAAEAPAPTLLSLPPHLPPSVTPASAAPASVDAAATSRVLLLRRVQLPEYLSSRRVRYRAEGSILVEWPNAVWAERIEVGATRELAASLRDALPGWTVCEAACPESAGPAPLMLQVAASPLDYRRGLRRTEGRLRAELSAPGGVAVVVDRALDAPATADTPQAQAESLAAWLQSAALAIAPSVQAARP